MTSHRVRSPLASCQGLMYLLKNNENLSVDERNQIIAHMEESAQQLDAFTVELTKFISGIKERYQLKT